MKLGIWGLLASMSLLPSICSGAALPGTEPPPFKFPGATYLYELEDFEDQGSIEKRTNVQVCQYVGVAANCVTIAVGLQQIVMTFATAIKQLSDEKSCATVSGTAAGGKVKYRYYATGRNCDTAAELKTIAGALEHHLKTETDGELCRTECLDLTHSGTWNGYLLMGPANHFESDMYCGPKLPFKSCDSGGKNDLH
ncbi:hypothetical protein BGZ61DRAFT_454206 [Ilyonectria robusta]|uniref:uncharacterized protein n=1 Tax=Ilyonectria robusta TaxID=1079257 RepID=UPI001E8D7CD9|nr:uncharacterized protein BGZ61DRAFT_454206 [Ilyonectria robusta]KAH8686204.1 hypothetical protein BGZ61DRAFT_454206 [Ilyonectria robusta]